MGLIETQEQEAIDLMIGDELKEQALKDIPDDEPLELDMSDTNTIWKIDCRWCGAEHESISSHVLVEPCVNCGCWMTTSFSVKQPDGKSEFNLYSNPDGSLFLEFVTDGQKTTRYVLSQEILAKAGALKFFDVDPKGAR